MTTKKLLAIAPLLLLQFGCSEFNRYQPPSVTNPYETLPSRKYPDDRKTLKPTVKPNTTQEIIKPPESEPQFIPPAMSPAVVALMSESDRNSRSGELESAVAVLERALRIDPRNPTLTYKLAQLRVKQSKYRLAEDLAKKAALLAAGDIALKRQSWLLISEARRKQQNYHGAKEAKLKAESFVRP